MTSKIIGIAAALTKSQKYTLLLVGAQFAYLGYKYFKEKKNDNIEGKLRKT